MDTQVLQQRMREKVEDHRQQQQQRGGKEEGYQQQPAVVLSSSSPPSASSSPAHEFSFTLSLHQPSSTTLAKPPPPSIAVDLSPADDIFFHGHLLPLHLLSHLPVSPRSSTNSLDSFTLPIKELLENHHHPTTAAAAAAATTASETKERPPKSKSFSLFGLSRWKSKGFEDREKGEIFKEKHKRKARFDLSRALKRYIRMVRPLLSSLGGRRRENNLEPRRRQQPYSFSGNLTPRGRQELRGRRGDQLFSAPASMRTSPTNSGLLVATSGAVPTSTSDSTMEELQAAIQAAIAHCKNSIAMEDNQMRKSG